VNNDATLVLSNALVLNEPLTLNSTASNPGALFAVGTSNLWTGNISLTNTARIGVATNTTLNLGGIISGTGSLEKEGDGRLIFSGANANIYLGRTVVKTGTLFCNKTGIDRAIPGELVIGDGIGGPDADLVFYSQNQINDLADVTIASSGKLLLGADTIGSLSGTGRVEILNTGELRTGNNNAGTTFDGVILGGGALTKRGSGIFTLTGNNTYTGPTTVEVGTLQVDGSQPNSDVTVRVNAILAGRGRVGDLSAATGGHVEPGSSPGRLTAQSMVLSNGAILHIELNGPVAGTSYDQLQVNTRPDLTDARLALSLSGFAPFEGQIFDIIDNRGSDADTGTFAGLPGGAVTNVSGIPLRINYGGVLGKDVTLTVTNLPLRGTTASITTGNGNSRADPNECNLLFLRVTNRNVAALTGIQGTLTTTTPGVIITEATSAYPNLGNGAAGTNSTPFQFYTTTDFNCGESIEFLLNIAATGHTPFALRFVLQSGVLSTPVAFSNNTAVALPGAGTVNSPIGVSGVSGGIAEVTVSMVLNYPNLSELFVLLVPPGGPAIPLAAGLNGSQLGTNCTNGRTVFGDDAARLVTDGVAPYVGTFRPISPLANLDGRTGAQLNGTWLLQIQDLVANSLVGALQCWSLTITPATCDEGGGICAACNGPFFGSITTNDPAIKAPIQGPLPSTCVSFDPCARTIVTVAGPTDVYTFTNSPAAACVTVQLEAPCLGPTNTLLSSAVLNGPHFTNCADLLGFSGLITNSPARYSFNVPSNAVFTVTVSGGGGLFGLGLCSNYTLRVDGFECAASLGLGRAGTNGIVVNWPTFAGDYQLQCATNVLFTNAVTVTNTAVVRDGDFVLTNDIAGPRQFYRLRKP
jgi:autotransporter-associated beta strand protein